MKTTIVAAAFASLLFSAVIVCAAESGRTDAKPFVHPGMLHSAADLDRMKKNVEEGVEPWAGAWREFQKSQYVANTYAPRPLETVGRGVGSAGQDNISRDGTAAYYNAIAWYISGNEDYAKKTVEILNDWSYKCKTINGKDAVLCAGNYGYKFANAAEIIRYSYKKWPQKDIEQFKTLMNAVFYPVIKDFSTFANGNWDACCFPTMMSIGIFCDDRAMFDRAVKYYMDGSGDGSLTNYIINKAGQCQESGRDQGHTQAGIGHLLIASEIAYHQGIDLYGAADNRLLAGVEYTAQYNLGKDVPFEPYSDKTGKYRANYISPISRGRLSAIYEMAYNHYQNRMGVEAPFTAQAAARNRPERSAIDHPGMGTLLFTLPANKPANQPPTTAPAIPGPVIAKGASSAVALRWAAALNASAYTVKRATTGGGPYTIIAQNIKMPAYTDAKVEAGKLYYYVVSAANDAGTSDDTLESAASAGLPSPWSQRDVGSVDVAGYTLFDGQTFTLEGAGTEVGGASDQFHFAYLPMSGDGTITARYVPQTPSQIAKMGLTMRDAPAADAANVSLLFTPKSTESVELPQWSIRLTRRATAAGETNGAGERHYLEQPYMMWGRLTEPYWLRLSRSGNTFTASISPDGQKWTQLGSTETPLKHTVFVGLLACSRLTKISTTVMFDNVTAPGWPKNRGERQGKLPSP